MNLILNLKNSTPMLVGWYKPEIIDPLGLRTTEIKGLWRWWARAFVGGVLYDNGILKGESDNSVLLKPNPCEVRCISKLVGTVLGLGLAIGDESMASMFTLFVEPNKVEPKRVQQLASWKNSQRVKLLSVGGRDLEAIPPGYSFKLHIEWNQSFNYAKTALKTLIVALQLSGLGKGARRGLGALDIVDINGENSISTEVKDKSKSLRDLIEEIYEECRRMIESDNEAKTIIQSELERCSRSTQSQSSLPPIPVLSKKKADSSNITEVRYYNIPESLFLRIHNFFLRSERCNVLHDSQKCEDEFRRKHAAWFLGLPRGQARRGPDGGKKLIAGYLASEKERRASPIHIAFHGDENLFGSGVFVTIMISGDWPKSIEWKGRDGSKPIEVTDQEILKAHSIYINEFDKYVERLVSRQQVKILWP